MTFARAWYMWKRTSRRGREEDDWSRCTDGSSSRPKRDCHTCNRHCHKHEPTGGGGGGFNYCRRLKCCPGAVGKGGAAGRSEQARAPAVRQRSGAVRADGRVPGRAADVRHRGAGVQAHPRVRHPYFKCEWLPNPTAGDPRRAPSGPRRTRCSRTGATAASTPSSSSTARSLKPQRRERRGKLLVHAYYSTASRRYERFVALEEAPGSYDESRFSPPFQYDYLYCGSSLYGNLSASRMREWVAYHAHFFGPRSHFVLHDAGGISPEVKAVLDPWVRAGRVTVQDIRAQEEYDGYYYNQFLVVNDCLHRYRHAANWTFFFDVDEYLYLPNGQKLDEVLGQLSGYSQFTIEQNPMSSKLCLQDPSRNYSREWGFEKLVFRNSITKVRRDRKYAIQARNAYSAGVHMSQNLYGRTTHKTENLIRYYHYHNSINVMGEPCREFVPMPVNGSKTMFEGFPTYMTITWSDWLTRSNGLRR
ncbi:unnamed protein product [Miscanthus lutarioriparius]|uniref:Glycosyltransferase family 92 protein n=1 Tax=Miscanthus lutarioriparius TaxID=422564 RepID=A0A811SF30_9POAL|nr:unnamed protein product [Miscanthus lutarioriparius]